jgi:hypothetical protein
LAEPLGTPPGALSSKNCSLNRKVECPSVGTIFLLIAFSERTAMALRYATAAKKVPSSIDKHVGSRVRMRRKMLAMSQMHLADALGVTYQQVQKNRKALTASGPAGCSNSPKSFRYQ